MVLYGDLPTRYLPTTYSSYCHKLRGVTEAEFNSTVSDRVRKYMDENNELKSRVSIREEQISELKAVIQEQKKTIQELRKIDEPQKEISTETKESKSDPKPTTVYECIGKCKNGKKCTKKVKIGHLCHNHKKSNN
jgi:uncharacterized coiled-coil protein SlyX